MILSIPKTIYVNFHLLPFKQAVCFPILVNWKTTIEGLNGKMLMDTVKPGIVRIGFGGSFALGGGTYIKLDGKIRIKGKCTMGRGTQLVVSKNGELVLGKNFNMNANCILNASRSITFGDDCLLGWNTTVLDSDGHKIIREKAASNICGIQIEDHVWICSDVKILKGAAVAKDSVVAANATITKSFEKRNLLIGGNNRIISENISWER